MTFKDLKIDSVYSCELTKEFAERNNKPSWTGKHVNLVFTGLVFRSLKDNNQIFVFEQDVKPISETK